MESLSEVELALFLASISSLHTNLRSTKNVISGSPSTNRTIVKLQPKNLIIGANIPQLELLALLKTRNAKKMPTTKAPSVNQ